MLDLVNWGIRPCALLDMSFFNGRASIWHRVATARLRIKPDLSPQRLLRAVAFARFLLQCCSHCLLAWLSQSRRDDAVVCKTRKGRREGRRRFGCETMEIKVTVALCVDTPTEHQRACYRARGISPIFLQFMSLLHGEKCTLD